MSNSVIYVGIDVDDNSFHFSAFFPLTGEVLEHKTRPTLKTLITKLEEIKTKFPNHSLKICYEATYIGYSLQRDLAKNKYDCVVIAPSSIPRVHGNQIKTDRIDATKLAQFFASGLLTIVTVPEKDTETDRDLLRSRQYILKQLVELRVHIQSLLRRNGIHYKAETKAVSHWSKQHLLWLERKIDELQGSLKSNLKLLYQQMKWLMHTMSEYAKEVDDLAKSDQYKEKVKSLVCYHGIKNVFAMVMITEIGNVKRFTHPGQLSSWIGLDIREYSSGGKHNRFGITKHGNKYLRTAFIEANQKLPKNKFVGRDLIVRRKDIDPKLIHIADRCRERLCKKGHRLLHAGKHPNKIKVASAREMVGFVWESLNTVSA
jgi:transposase